MKKVLFFGIIALLLFPALEKELKFYSGSNLFGDFIPVKKPVFTFEKYFKGDFQINSETYLKDNIGYKNFFIRVYNQMLFSLYRKGNTPKGIIGNDQYLYLRSYIDNVTGENYIGHNRIQTITDQIGFLQEYFQRRGKLFFTVVLPSKASYYPEFIPDRFEMLPNTNYENYISCFNQSGIKYIDLNKFFIADKEEAKYPIFPKNGVHWTTYAMLNGLDTVFNYIEANSKFKIADNLRMGEINMGPSNDPADNDVEQFFNLLFELPKDNVANVELIFHSKEKQSRPKTVVIGDSYYYKVYNHKIPNELFDWGAYWFYNKKSRRYSGGQEFVNKVEDIDPLSFLHQQDIIILWVSHATMHLFPYGFEEYAAALVDKDTLAVKNYLVNKLKAGHSSIDSLQSSNTIDILKQTNAFISRFNLKSLFIRNKVESFKKSEEAMMSIKKKAQTNGISDSAMMVLEAEWYYNQKLKEDAIYAIPQNIKDIKSNSEKMRLLKTKALEQGISIDEMIKLEAELQFINEHRDTEDAQILMNMHKIKSNQTWYNSIIEKAKANGLSVEKMLEKDAIWLYKKNQKNR